jgi:hypothetical protein
LNGALLYAATFDSVSGLTITGSSDNDTLTVDLSGGNPIPGSGLIYDGAGPGDFDVLSIVGATGGSLVYTTSGVSSGTIDLGGSLISYNHLEPIYDDMVLADRVFVFGPEADTIHVDVGATRTVVTSPFSELVDFVNPTGTVTIRTGAGDHNIVVTGNPTYELLIDARGGNNSVTGTARVGAVVTGTNGADRIDVGQSVAGMLTISVNDTVSTLTGAVSVIVNALGGPDTVTLHGLTIPATVMAGEGNDLVDASGVIAGAVTLNGGPGEDTLIGGTGAGTVVATSGSTAADSMDLHGKNTQHVENARESTTDHVGLAWTAHWLELAQLDADVQQHGLRELIGDHREQELKQFGHMGGKSALFSVDGVTLHGDGVARDSTDYATTGEQAFAGWTHGAGTRGRAAASDGDQPMEQNGTEAKKKAEAKSIDWNDSFRGLGLGTTSSQLGGKRGAHQPNLAGFKH